MAKRRPNFLFLLPDQHRSDWLGDNPELDLRTPVLAALMRRGVKFTRAITPSPLCAPARAMLATGLAYDATGVFDNGQDLPLGLPTHYQSLRAAGYRVCGVGKFDLHKDLSKPLWWELDGSRNLDDWGFTEGIDNEGKLDGVNSYRRAGNQPQGPYLNHLHRKGLAEAYCGAYGHGPHFINPLPDEDYCDTWVGENAMGFLRGFPADQPWYLVVNFTGPHNPFEITEGMKATVADRSYPSPVCPDGKVAAADHRHIRQNYAAMIENIDVQCGRLIAEVEKRGELDNTIIVFSSDHGEMLGDHGRFGKNTWRRASTGIPMIVAGPGVRRGAVSDALVSLHDLAPTFLDYAGAEPLPNCDGKSIRPILSGEAEKVRDVARSALRNREGRGWEMYFDGRVKRVVDNGVEMLFDLAADPGEIADLAAGEEGPAK